MGVAEYADPGNDPYRILINEAAAKSMDKTFSGKPLYVLHVDKVDLHNIQAQADGYVTRSFYNKADGAHWAEFILVSDAAHKAYRDGWKLSNAYHPTFRNSSQGVWQGVQYDKEVDAGVYEHLALVPNPRYSESIILTEEEFKKYNAVREAESSQRLANSLLKEKVMAKFSLFKRRAVENTTDLNLEELMVVLPKCKRELSIANALDQLDASLMKNMDGYANDDHMVKVGDEEMSVAQLVKWATKAKAAEEEAEGEVKENESDDDKDKDKDKDKDEDKDKKKKDKQENDDDTLSRDQQPGDSHQGDKAKTEFEKAAKERDGKERASLTKSLDAAAPDKAEHVEDKHDKPKPDKEQGKKNFDKLKNADRSLLTDQAVVHTNFDRVALGKARYGSI